MRTNGLRSDNSMISDITKLFFKSLNTFTTFMQNYNKTKLEARGGEKEESDRCRSRPHGRELRSGNGKLLVRERADERAEAMKKERNRTLKPARGNATV
ncbi:hypothetical protein NDU88_006945 [Pleurodeles waltl]|uniref:Uncharacterized protein n=1 Tax=Pleurodeles waltl TaxID=8319 RepID=A0AAV7MDQ7_PLEWA|nr:hypothetical protein NDU88_006945 [Pleurodeles waltl]